MVVGQDANVKIKGTFISARFLFIGATMKIPRIVHKLTKEVRSNLIKNNHYIIAVSGGADSLVLANICSELEAEDFARFTVCHIEHGIRGQEALDDMAFVEKYCKERKMCFVGIHVNALRYAETNKLSIEDAARKLRYEALRNTMQGLGADKILTAHQADDQAETVLWRLLRGSGLDGLSGMSIVNGEILRPLLNITRQEISCYLIEKGLAHREDSTNKDLNYTRNKIRQELLPYLANNYNERIRDVLSRTAKVLAEDALCLEELAQSEYNQVVEIEESSQLVLDVKRMDILKPAICKRVLRYACFKFGVIDLGFERTQALYELILRKTGNKVIELPQGIIVTFKNHKLLFSKKY